MKRILAGLVLSLALLSSGCGTVVYEVRPDAAPAMEYQEALEAMELALSMMNRRGIGVAKADGEGIMIIYASRQPYVSIPTSTLSYDDVERNVREMGGAYFVFVTIRGLSNLNRTSFSWKSAEEARLFVDAAHVLSRGPQRMTRTSVRSRPVSSPSRVARNQEPVPPVTETPPSMKQPEPPAASPVPTPVAKAPVQPPKPADTPRATPKPPQVTKPAETPPVTPPAAQPPAVPVKAAAKPTIQRKEEPPPTITITSPDATRAVRIAARQSGVLVTGVARSGVGVSEVAVNGQPAELDEKGNFSQEVFLRVGENRITVAARDIRGRFTEKQILIHRESGKVTQARKESPAPAEAIAASTYHALLIAVQDYDSGDITRLDNPIADAHRLKGVLTADYTFDPANVVVLENPDRRAIFKALQAMRRKLTPRDSLLIFFAGHGMWVEDMRQGFWLPRDASGINDPSDWIPNSTIRDYIKSFQARHILLVSDACFSGGIFKVRDAFPTRSLAIDKIFEMHSRKAITSGALKFVPDRSVFVEFLVKRLKDNRDPYLDSQKLFTSLREAVINNSPTGQTPLYGAISEAGDEGGDFVFVRK